MDSFQPYPIEYDIPAVESDFIYWSNCSYYRHKSVLRFQINDTFDGYKYVCVATANDQDEKFASITIYTEKCKLILCSYVLQL